MFNKNNHATSWEQVKRERVKGCCFTCSPPDEYFDFDNPPCNDEAQIFFRCQGKIFERPMSPVCLFQSDSSAITIPNARSQVSVSGKTLKALSEDLPVSLADSEGFHFLCANELGRFDISNKLATYGNDSYFVAALKESPKPLCVIFPCGVENEIEIHLTSAQNRRISKKVQIEVTVNDLLKTIANMFSGSAVMDNLVIYSAKSINYDLERRVDSYTGTIIVSKAKYSLCKGDSKDGDCVPLLDYTHDVSSISECPLTFEPIHESYAICASPCNHKFSQIGFYEFLKQETIKSIVLANSNNNTKDLFPYIVKCPLRCEEGGVSIQTTRFCPEIYRILRQWSTIAYEINEGAIFCGLPTHEGDVPYFKLEEEDEQQMRVSY